MKKSRKIEDEDKIEEKVIGEQGLAALAWGKFEELYEIEGRCYWTTAAFS